jgi:hypothetical protein
MTFDEWYRMFWRGPAPNESVASHRDSARAAWSSARVSVALPEPLESAPPESASPRKEITPDEYWQRQREKFWRQAYTVAYQAALTSPDPLPPQVSKDTPNYAHNVAFLAAEEALIDLDTSRKRGRLSYRYYF